MELFTVISILKWIEKSEKKINYADYEEEVLSRVTIMEVLSMGDDSSILWDI